MIHVEVLDKTQKGIRDFMELPYRLYRKDKNWVPPIYDMQLRSLLGDNNPLLCGEHRFFMAYDDQRPVARVLAGVDGRLNERLGEKRGYISLFETENNMEYCRAVLDQATAYLRELGMTRVVGPNTPGFNDFSKGVLYQGFDGQPMVFNPYNPPFYNDFLVQYGFKKHRDHYAYWMKLKDFPVQSYIDLKNKAQKRFHFTVKHIDVHRESADKLAQDMSRVINEAFPDDWELVPPTKDDMLEEIKSLNDYALSELVVMAYAGERPVGLFVAFPDFNRLLKDMGGHRFPFGWLRLLFHRRAIGAARCLMMFVVPEYQNKAVGVAMMISAYEKARELGIREIEASTIDETNVSSIVNTERTGAKRYRVYRQYEMEL